MVKLTLQVAYQTPIEVLTLNSWRSGLLGFMLFVTVYVYCFPNTTPS